MNTLLKTLLERNLIPDNSVFTGRVRTNTLGGTQLKVRKSVYYNKLSNRGFVCRGELGESYVMEFNDLESVDGMDLVRFARVYNIKADGSGAKTGKKRGRKPRAQINKDNGGSNNGKNQRTNTNNQVESTA
jgi:hypothetical protein